MSSDYNSGNPSRNGADSGLSRVIRITSKDNMIYATDIGKHVAAEPLGFKKIEAQFAFDIKELQEVFESNSTAADTKVSPETVSDISSAVSAAVASDTKEYTTRSVVRAVANDLQLLKTSDFIQNSAEKIAQLNNISTIVDQNSGIVTDLLTVFEQESTVVNQLTLDLQSTTTTILDAISTSLHDERSTTLAESTSIQSTIDSSASTLSAQNTAGLATVTGAASSVSATQQSISDTVNAIESSVLNGPIDSSVVDSILLASLSSGSISAANADLISTFDASLPTEQISTLSETITGTVSTVSDVTSQLVDIPAASMTDNVLSAIQTDFSTQITSNLQASVSTGDVSVAIAVAESNALQLDQDRKSTLEQLETNTVNVQSTLDTTNEQLTNITSTALALEALVGNVQVTSSVSRAEANNARVQNQETELTSMQNAIAANAYTLRNNSNLIETLRSSQTSQNESVTKVLSETSSIEGYFATDAVYTGTQRKVLGVDVISLDSDFSTETSRLSEINGIAESLPTSVEQASQMFYDEHISGMAERIESDVSTNVSTITASTEQTIVSAVNTRVSTTVQDAISIGLADIRADTEALLADISTVADTVVVNVSTMSTQLASDTAYNNAIVDTLSQAVEQDKIDSRVVFLDIYDPSNQDYQVVKNSNMVWRHRYLQQENDTLRWERSLSPYAQLCAHLENKEAGYKFRTAYRIVSDDLTHATSSGLEYTGKGYVIKRNEVFYIEHCWYQNGYISSVGKRLLWMPAEAANDLYGILNQSQDHSHAGATAKQYIDTKILMSDTHIHGGKTMTNSHNGLGRLYSATINNSNLNLSVDVYYQLTLEVTDTISFGLNVPQSSQSDFTSVINVQSHQSDVLRLDFGYSLSRIDTAPFTAAAGSANDATLFADLSEIATISDVKLSNQVTFVFQSDVYLENVRKYMFFVSESKVETVELSKDFAVVHTLNNQTGPFIVCSGPLNTTLITQVYHKYTDTGNAQQESGVGSANFAHGTTLTYSESLLQQNIQNNAQLALEQAQSSIS